MARLLIDDRVYEFPNISHKYQHVIQSRPLLFAYVEDTVDVWDIIGENRTLACGQLQAYYRLRGDHCRWISIVESTGFRNPTMLYSDSDPELYLTTKGRK